MSSLSDNTTRRALGMAGSQQYRTERTGTDGYEGKVPRGAYDIRLDRLERELYVDALRTQVRADELPLILVCGECGHRHPACDCPASVQRSVPLRPAKGSRS